MSTDAYFEYDYDLVPVLVGQQTNALATVGRRELGSYDSKTAGWFRFNVPVLNRGIMQYGVLSFFVEELSGGDMDMQIGVAEVDDASTPVDEAAAETQMDTITNWTNFTIRKSDVGQRIYVDVASQLQLLVDRSGWVKDNTAIFYIRSSVSDLGLSQFTRLNTYSFNAATTGDQTNAPQLSGGFAPNLRPPGWPPGVGPSASAKSTWEFKQFGDGRVQPKGYATSTLTFEHTGSANKVTGDGATSVLTFTQTGSAPATIFASATSNIVFGQSGSFQREVSRSATSIWNIRQGINAQRLTFTQSGSFSFERARSAVSALTLTQTGKHDQPRATAQQKLTLTQSGSFVLLTSEGATSELTFTQTASWAGTWMRSATSNLVFSQRGYSMTNFNTGRPTESDPGGTNPGEFWGYGSKNIGYHAGREWPGAPGGTLPGPAVFTLSFGVDVITLPSPIFTDKQQVQSTRINRTTRGGQRIVFADANWVWLEILRYKFQGLSRAEYDAFVDFRQNHIGKEVHLITHEGRQYDGFILDPDSEGTEEILNCGYVVELVFDGKLLTFELP